MRNPQAVFLTSIFLFFIAIPGTIMLFDAGETVSLVEKRQLAVMPKLEANLTSIKAFPVAFEAFFNDHFGLKSALVRLYSQVLVGVFQTSPNWLVVKGQDGWLFFAGDAALADFTGYYSHTQTTMNQWKQTLKDRSAWLNSMGVRYLFLIAPNKSSVYPEYLPERFLSRQALDNLTRLQATLDDPPVFADTVDLKAALLQEKGNGLLYHKSDTHWNLYGAYVAYRAIIEKLADNFPELKPIKREDLDFQMGTLHGGDMSMMINLPNWYEESMPVFTANWTNAIGPWKLEELPSEDSTAQKSSRAGRREVNGTAGQRLTAIFISDSFGSGLMDYLATHFHKITHIPYARFEDIAQTIATERPDIVIELNVARNMHEALGENIELAQEMMEKEIVNGPVLLDVTPSNYATFFAGSADLTIGKTSEEGINLEATGGDPQLILSAGDGQSTGVTTVKCLIKSPTDTVLALYYRGPQDVHFSAERVAIQNLQAGENTLLFRIYQPIRLDSIRLDPGVVGGSYYLQRLLLVGSHSGW